MSNPPNEAMRRQGQSMIAELLRETTADKVATVRNTCLGGAATATAILIALTQVGIKEKSLAVAVVGCALAAPIWLALATVLEIYLHMGETSFKHLGVLRTSKGYLCLQYVAGAGLYAALAGIVYFLFPWALLVFLATTVFSLGYLCYATSRLIMWWPRRS